jgi:hypothetical protein
VRSLGIYWTSLPSSSSFLFSWDLLQIPSFIYFLSFLKFEIKF